MRLVATAGLPPRQKRRNAPISGGIAGREHGIIVRWRVPPKGSFWYLSVRGLENGSGVVGGDIGGNPHRGAVDVVVVAYNSDDALRRSLPLAQQIAGVERVVVVNNGPDRATSRLARDLGAEAIDAPGNPGFGTGQNIGVRQGTAPYILLLNPDAEPAVQAVAAGIEWLSAHPDVAAVQGVITNRGDGRPERSQGRELGAAHLLGRALGLRRLLRWRAVGALGRRVGWLRDHVERVPAAPADVETLAATAVLMRRSAFHQVDGFDESYFLYGEDLDLCRRLRAAGWRLVALPSAWARHTSGGSSTSWFDRELRWWQGTLRFAACWWGPLAWSGARTAAGVQWVRMTMRAPRRSGEAWRDLVGDPPRVRRAGRPRRTA